MKLASVLENIFSTRRSTKATATSSVMTSTFFKYEPQAVQQMNQSCCFLTCLSKVLYFLRLSYLLLKSNIIFPVSVPSILVVIMVDQQVRALKSTGQKKTFLVLIVYKIEMRAKTSRTTLTLFLFCISVICPSSPFISPPVSPLSLTIAHAPLSPPPSHGRPPVCGGDPPALSSWLLVSQLPGPLRLGRLPPCPLLSSPPPHVLRPHSCPRHHRHPPHFSQSLTHLSYPLPGSGSLWPANTNNMLY